MRAAVFLVVLLSACAGYDDLALLEVDTIEPPEIEHMRWMLEWLGLLDRYFRYSVVGLQRVPA